MLEAAHILASVGALVLLVAGAFWIKVARYAKVDGGGNVVASQIESASAASVSGNSQPSGSIPRGGRLDRRLKREQDATTATGYGIRST